MDGSGCSSSELCCAHTHAHAHAHDEMLCSRAGGLARPARRPHDPGTPPPHISIRHAQSYSTFSTSLVNASTNGIICKSCCNTQRYSVTQGNMMSCNVVSYHIKRCEHQHQLSHQTVSEPCSYSHHIHINVMSPRNKTTPNHTSQHYALLQYARPHNILACIF